ncbi:MerR family transcriptional regulator [Rhizobium sp. G187]|uniref:MerR family transcriptional regulator n=1 Tax=Rhizobium sp. G187 TaxID=3451352 RepID=UPI003EE7A2DC
MNGAKPLKKVGKQADPSTDDIFLPEITLPLDAPAEPVAIADMAEYFGVTHRTLHFYEEKGLIEASRIGLMRIYRRRDVLRMALINACREIGMPISVIQDLFESLATASSVTQANEMFEEALSARRRELTAHLSTVHRQLQQINSLLVQGEDDNQPAAIRATSNLSEAELTCLHLMAEGFTTTRIARKLDLKFDETEEIERHVISKIGAQNRFQAVAKAVLLGLVAN